MSRASRTFGHIQPIWDHAARFGIEIVDVRDEDVPYAIAAKLAFADHTIVAVVGDGSFGFNAIEMVRHAAPSLVIVANNAAWNIERHDQFVNYEGRVVGTLLRQSDYAALARSLGAHGGQVTDSNELEPALRRALATLPAVIDVVVTRDAVSSDGSKGLAIVPDYQGLAEWDALERRRRQPNAPWAPNTQM